MPSCTRFRQIVHKERWIVKQIFQGEFYQDAQNHLNVLNNLNVPNDLNHLNELNDPNEQEMGSGHGERLVIKDVG